MTGNTRALLHASPERAARYLDERLRAGSWQAEQLEAAARKSPDDFVADLIAILVRSDEIAADLPVRVLSRRQPELARAVLTAQWPQIAARLGIPINVAEMLQVRKKSLWKMVLSDDL